MWSAVKKSEIAKILKILKIRKALNFTRYAMLMGVSAVRLLDLSEFYVKSLYASAFLQCFARFGT